MIEHLGTPPIRPGGVQMPYTPAVRAGDFLFISGQLGIDTDGRPVAEDVGGQLRQCMQRIRQMLQAAGGDLRNVVKANVWLTDKADFPVFNAVYRELMPAPFPARSTVVNALVVPGARVEIDVVAYLGK